MRHSNMIRAQARTWVVGTLQDNIGYQWSNDLNHPLPWVFTLCLFFSSQLHPGCYGLTLHFSSKTAQKRELDKWFYALLYVLLIFKHPQFHVRGIPFLPSVQFQTRGIRNDRLNQCWCFAYQHPSIEIILRVKNLWNLFFK